MIEAGEVGARFVIINEASPVLERLMSQFKALDGQISETKKQLSSLRVPPSVNASLENMERNLTKLSVGFDKIDTAFGKIGGSADAAAIDVSGAFGKIDGSIGSTQKLIADLSLELGRVGAQVTALAAGAGSAVAAAGGGGAGLGHRPRIGGAGGAGGGGGIGNVGARVPLPHPLHGGTMHGPVMVGAVLAGFGEFESLKYGMELAKIQQDLLINGVAPGKIDEATNLSYAMGEQFGQPVQSVLDTIDELRNPLGGIGPAMEHTKHLGGAMVDLRALGIKTGKPLADQMYALVKSTEFRNAITDEKFDPAIDAMVRAAMATAGRVGPSEFLQMSKYMRSALPGLSDDFLYKYAPELAQEFGGSSAGTSLSAVYQQVVSGQMRTTGLRLLDSLGEIDRSKVDFDKNGRIVKARPGANKLGDIFKNDPAEYAQALIKDLDSHGITQEGAQRDYMSMIFGNRLSAQMMMTLGYQRMRLDRGAAGIGQTMHADAAAKELLANDPTTNMNAMTAAWTNMLTAFGGLTMKPATMGMQGLADVFNVLRHPLSNWNGPSEWGKGIFWNPSAFPVDHVIAKEPDSLFGMWRERNKAQSSLFRSGYRGSDLDREMGREGARGKASPDRIVQPPPVINLQNNVRVMIDGKQIAAAVEADLVGQGFTMGHNSQDSHANYSAPDVSGSGHQ